MAAQSQNLSVELDTSTLARLAERMGQVGPALPHLMDMAVNQVAVEVNDTAETGAAGYLNLAQDYIKSKVTKTSAVDGSARAVVSAEIQGTTMQRFSGGMKQMVSPNVSKGGKGDSSNNRGIAPGYKAAGIDVGVYRGRGNIHFGKGFIMRLSNEAGFGLFARDANGSLKHIYGPSVYQTFRKYITDNGEKIADQLERAAITQLDKAIQDFLR